MSRLALLPFPPSVLAAVLAALLLLLGALTSLAPALHAHEIPPQVVARLFVRPAGDTLHLLVRVPVAAMRDVDFPVKGAGYLDVTRADAALRDAARLWVADGLRLFEDGRPLPVPVVLGARASLPADGAFETYDLARASVAGAPLAPDVDVLATQATLDVMLAVPITSANAQFSMESSLAGLGIRTTTIVRFVPPGGEERLYTFEGDPGRLAFTPGGWQVTGHFLREGITHILGGIDHLLFLLCLVLPFRQLRPLVALVTAFTVAHSITLVASALGWVPTAGWFAPGVETLIALSLVFMACENMLGAKLGRRWVVAFAFGLVHGFGFSFALGDRLQFAGGNLAVALAAFNVGVELGSIAVLLVAVPALAWFLRRVPERGGVILLSAFAAHTGWHWTTERWAALAAHPFTMPALDRALALALVQGTLLVLVAIACGWALHETLGRWTRRGAGIAAALLLGLAASAMPASPLHAQQAKPAAKPATQPAGKGAGRSTKDGVYTAEQATQGREVFVGNCMGCHTVASHTGAAFITKWKRKSVDDLFTYIRNSMPKTAPGSLEESEYVWVTAYILKLNGMPAGTSELPAEPALLKAIRIDTKDP